MSVSLDHRDPAVGVVSLIGEHDAYSSLRLENELAVLIDGGIGVVVDLREASFIDSQTLSVLLSARHQAEESSLGFALVLAAGEDTQVHRLLDLTGLESAFVIFPTLEPAKAAASPGQVAGERVHAG